MEKMTQNEMILKHMRDFGSITPLEAMRDLGVYRLASRICDLKKMGYKIKTEPSRVPTRYGGTTIVSSYSIEV